MAISSVIWWRHSFLFNKEMSENSKNWGVNIERENLHIFWTTWGTSMKFLQKTRLHPLSRIYKFGTSYNYCKNLKWKKPFQDFRVFDFGYRAKFLSQFTFCRFWIIRYNNCQNLKLGNAFRDILVFYFGYRANWRLRNFANFLFFF